jgi:hypothetical protein
VAYANGNGNRRFEIDEDTAASSKKVIGTVSAPRIAEANNWLTYRIGSTIAGNLMCHRAELAKSPTKVLPLVTGSPTWALKSAVSIFQPC